MSHTSPAAARFSIIDVEECAELGGARGFADAYELAAEKAKSRGHRIKIIDTMAVIGAEVVWVVTPAGEAKVTAYKRSTSEGT